MTLTDEQIRQKFEERFPIPKGVIFENAINNYSYICFVGAQGVSAFPNEYRGMWHGFKAALSLQGEAVPVAIPSAPKKIWLNIGDTDFEEVEREGWKWSDLSDVTWCEDKIDQCDIPYIRADLAFTSPPLTTEKEAELIRKCAAACRELAEDGNKLIPGWGGYENQAAADQACLDCEKVILALLPEEGKG